MALDPELLEIAQIFFEESFEGLDTMEAGLLNLEQDDNEDPELLNSIFRAAHSIKGGGATFGFDDISEFTHGVETILDEMRNHKRGVNKADVQLLLQAVDCLREMVSANKEQTGVNTARVTDLTRAIQHAVAQSDPPATEPAPTESEPASAFEQPVENTPHGWRITVAPHGSQNRVDPLRIISALQDLGQTEIRVDSSALPPFAELDPRHLYLRWEIDLVTKAEKSEIEQAMQLVGIDPALALVPLDSGDGVAINQPAVHPAIDAITDSKREQSVFESDKTAGNSITLSKSPATHPPTASPRESASIRVNIDKIDALLNLVGELVITQSMLNRFSEDFDITQLDALRVGLTQLSRNTRELQEHAMQIRMLPINFSFNRIPRLIHDLNDKFGKQVELKMSGENTELDKTMLEQLNDPLVHLVRNALDHGIETPEVRRAAGKNETGTLELKAYHESGNIVVEIRDDGAGIDKTKVLEKARQKGLVAENEEVSDERINDLIFQPGFSTVDEVTDVSGRGVGMDVVRRNVNELGGHVSVHSEEGKGSTVFLRLPLTLAILDGQLVRVGTEIYVVPLVSIVETIQVEIERVKTVSKAGELYRLRDEYIPILRLYRRLGSTPDSEELKHGLLVVVEIGSRRIGVLVDDLLGQQQVVIKSLDHNFFHVRGLAGATILGDGMVALILDMPGLIPSTLGGIGGVAEAA